MTARITRKAKPRATEDAFRTPLAVHGGMINVVGTFNEELPLLIDDCVSENKEVTIRLSVLRNLASKIIDSSRR